MTHPLLEHLPADCRDDFQRHIVQKDYLRGEVIFHQGAKTLGLYFIDSGMVQFQIDNTSGKSTFIGTTPPLYGGNCLHRLPHWPVTQTIFRKSHGRISTFCHCCCNTASQKPAFTANGTDGSPSMVCRTKPGRHSHLSCYAFWY